MQNNFRGLLGQTIVATSLLLGACAGFSSNSQAVKCEAGLQCEFHGKLSVFHGEPASVVTVDSSQVCVKLALPENYAQNLDAWNGKDVSVYGVAFDQFHDPSTAMTWFSYKGRKVGMGVCDHGLGIYVESMSEHRNNGDKRDGGN